MEQKKAIASLHASLGLGQRKARPSPAAKRREIQAGQAAVLERVLIEIRKRARETPAWANAYNSAATAVELELAAVRIDARQSVAAPDARDAALDEAWTAIEAKRRATVNDPSAKNALFDATEIIRDLQAAAPVQGKASDAEGGVAEMELALYRDAYGTQAPTEALIAVIDERQRQIKAEGWTPEHDDAYTKYEMRWAAVCYALTHNMTTPTNLPASWPWAPAWWKPTTERRNLVKAGALILAEIERLDRDAARAQQQGGSDV